MAWMRLTGYADKFGVHPGDTIRFHVNCDGPKQYDAQLVKMIHGDTNPRGPGFIEKKLKASFNGTYKGRKQVIHSGSYGFVTGSAAAAGRKLHPAVLGLADDAQDPSEILEAWRAGTVDQVVQQEGLRSLHQRRGLRRAPNQRREDHNRRSVA